MKILLIKFRNIGDVLLSTPLLENLRRHYPDADIDFAVNDYCTDILQHHPHIRRLLTYPRGAIRQAGLLGRIGHELSYTRSLSREKYDLVINLTEGDRGAFLTWLCRAGDAMGFKPRKGLAARLPAFRAVGDEHLPSHTVNKDLQFLPLLDKSVLGKRVSIHWGAEQEASVNRLLESHQLTEFVLIHPVARWLFKCWDEARFARVIDHVQQELGLPVVISAAPDEKELARVRAILGHCNSSPIDLSGRLSLTELACLASRARLFVGVDTAPMHIAAAVDTPVIALFGHSRPLFWGPWDNDLDQDYHEPAGIQRHGRHTLIQKEYGEIIYRDGVKLSSGMLRIGTQEVIEQIHARLSAG